MRATPSLADRDQRRRWLRACVAAETVGMTAASGAAVLADPLAPAPALVVVVAGGLVEGAALGWLQSRVLARSVPRAAARRYALATVLVAGVGWAAASAPRVLADDGATGGGPPPVVVALLAAGLGLVMGAVLGLAQASALRGAVAHPRRWIGAGVAAWPPTMAVIFTGATLPDRSWSAASIIATGVVTGAVAGACLGVVSGWFLPSLEGTSAVGRVVLRRLGQPGARRLRRSVVGLEVVGLRTGRRHRLPVQYADVPEGLVVVPGHPGRKTWWRNLSREPRRVRVLRDGAWSPAEARLVGSADPEHPAVRAAYELRWHRTLPADQPIVVVRLADRAPRGARSTLPPGPVGLDARRGIGRALRSAGTPGPSVGMDPMVSWRAPRSPMRSCTSR